MEDLNVFVKAVEDGDLKIVKTYINEWKSTLNNDITAKNIVSILINIQKLYG